MFLSRILPSGLKRFSRPLLRALITTLLRLRARSLVLHDGLLLVISPHQDDGTLGCAGVVSAHRQKGNQVASLYLTDGSRSHVGHPALAPANIAALRRAEALVADQIAGVDAAQITFMDLPDGRLNAQAPAERATAVERLATYLIAQRPSTVMLPCRRDGSDEHEAAFQLVRDAIRRSGVQPRILEYPIWSLWSPLRLMRPFFRAGSVYCHAFPGNGALKARALSAYATQFSPTPPWTKAVLPEDFGVAFSSEIEFFFES